MFERVVSATRWHLTLDGTVETHSESARHIILSYGDRVYYVSTVKVQFCEGQETHKAVFHAKDATGGQLEDLDLDVPQKLYEILVEYTKMGNSDLILVLHVENKEFTWGLVRESWLRRFMSKDTVAGYVV
jgi:hypothetical protein